MILVMEGATVRESSALMRLLAARVPLTLLVDIVAPPDPEQLYLDEGRDNDGYLMRDPVPVA
jgi:hypothetical protein